MEKHLIWSSAWRCWCVFNSPSRVLDSILSPDNRPVPDLLSWPHFARYSLAGESLSSPAESFGISSQLYLSFLSLVFNTWRLSYRNSSWDLPSTSQLTCLPSSGDLITHSITNARSPGPLKRVCVCVCLMVWETRDYYRFYHIAKCMLYLSVCVLR